MRSYGDNLFWPKRHEPSVRIKPINPDRAIVFIYDMPVEHKPLGIAPGGINTEVVAAGRKDLPAPLPVIADSPITDPLSDRLLSLLSQLLSVLP